MTILINKVAKLTWVVCETTSENVMETCNKSVWRRLCHGYGEGRLEYYSLVAGHAGRPPHPRGIQNTSQNVVYHGCYSSFVKYKWHRTGSSPTKTLRLHALRLAWWSTTKTCSKPALDQPEAPPAKRPSDDTRHGGDCAGRNKERGSKAQAQWRRRGLGQIQAWLAQLPQETMRRWRWR